MERADAVVIGAGVHGASAAYHLSKSGLDVLLIEKGAVASGASGVSGGIIRAHYSTEPMIRLAHRAAQRWPLLAEELGQPVGFVRTGMVVVAPPEDAESMRGIVALQRRIGVDAELISTSQIPEILPEFRTDGLALATFERQAGYADPHATVTAFVHKARELGTRTWLGVRVTGLQVEGGRIRSVMTDRGPVVTPLVVNCAGAWAGPIAAMCGVDLPVQPARLDMLALKTSYPGWTRESPTWMDLTSLTYGRADPTGLMLAGGGSGENDAFMGPPPDPDASGVLRPTEAFHMAILDGIVRRFEWARTAQVSTSWTGIDGSSPDFHLIFGPVTGVGGYLQVAGGSGNSFKLSPATGEAVAEYVTTGRCSYLDVEAFGLERFATGHQLRGVYRMHIVG